MQVPAIRFHSCRADAFAEANLLHREWANFPGHLLAIDRLTVGVSGVHDGILREGNLGKQSRSGSGADRGDEIPARKFRENRHNSSSTA